MAEDWDSVLARLLQDRSSVTPAQGGGYRPATVSFDWLGQLPQIADIAEAKRKRAEILGGLPSEADWSDPRVAEGIAGRLARGNDLEGALKFFDIAQKQRTLIEQQMFRKMYGSLSRGGGVPPTPAPGAEPLGTGERQQFPSNPFSGVAPAPAAPAQAPPTAWPENPLSGMGPRSELPPPPPQSPSDQVIAAAQAGAAQAGAAQAGPGAAPIQVAQAGGPPSGGPPSGGPAGGLPNWYNLPELQARPVPAAPVPPPPQVPAAPGGQRLPPSGTATQQQVEGIKEIARRLWAQGQAGKGAGGMPTTQADLILFKNAVERAYPTDALSREYLNEQADAVVAGRPTMEFRDWKVLRDRQPDIHAKASEKYSKIAEEGNAAREMQVITGISRELLNNPDAILGSGGKSLAGNTSMIASLRDAASSWLGVNIPIGALETPAAIYNTLDILQKRATLALLGGSLQKGVSEGDRTFSEKIPGSLEVGTRESLIVANEINHALAQRKIEIANLVNQYMRPGGNTTNARANSEDIDSIIRKYAEDNPIFRDSKGRPTALGQRIEEMVGKGTGIPKPPPTEDRVIGPNGSQWIKRGGRLYPMQPSGGQ